MAARLAALPDPADFGSRLDTLDRQRPVDLRGSLLHSVGRAHLALRAGRVSEADRELDRAEALIEEQRSRVPEPFQADVVD